MKRATKVRIYPDDELAAFLNAQFGAVRFVFNKALHLMRYQYQGHDVSLKSLRDIKPLLVVAKNSRLYHWLDEYASQALQQGVINLNRAFSNFFQQRTKFPRFKSKHGKQSSYHPNSKVFAASILLLKMKPIKAVIHRQISGTPVLKRASVAVIR